MTRLEVDGRIKQFCPQGHDTFVVGRTRSGGCCRECSRAYARRRSVRLHPRRQRKQFCPRGHDTFVVGRYVANGKLARCKSCTKQDATRYRAAHRRRRTTGDLTRERRWRQNNRIRSNEHKDTYRRRTQGLAAAEFESVVAYYGTACVYCGGEATGFDHLHPVSKGGAHEALNLATACINCNQRKNNRPIWVMVGQEGGKARGA